MPLEGLAQVVLSCSQGGVILRAEVRLLAFVPLEIGLRHMAALRPVVALIVPLGERYDGVYHVRPR